MSEISVQRSDAGKAITLHVGDVLSVRLPELRTAGYQWVVDTIDPRVLVLRASNYTAPQGTALGASGIRTMLMNSVAPGQTSLKLASRRPWESANAAGEQFEITVSVV
jgi:predicted secreted protein